MSVFGQLSSNEELCKQFMAEIDGILTAKFQTTSGSDVTVDHIINKPEHIHAAMSEVYHIPVSVSVAVPLGALVARILDQPDTSKLALSFNMDIVSKIQEKLTTIRANISRAVPIGFNIRSIQSKFPITMGLRTNITLNSTTEESTTVADTLQRSGFSAVIPALSTLTNTIEVINKQATIDRLNTLVKWGIDPVVEDLVTGCIPVSSTSLHCNNTYGLQDDLVLVPVSSELYAAAVQLATVDNPIVTVGSESEEIFSLMSSSLVTAATSAAHTIKKVNAYTRISEIEFTLIPLESTTLQIMDKSQFLTTLNAFAGGENDVMGIQMIIDCTFYASADGSIVRQPRFILNDNYRFIHKPATNGNGRLQCIRNIKKQTVRPLPMASAALGALLVQTPAIESSDAMDIDTL